MQAPAIEKGPVFWFGINMTGNALRIIIYRLLSGAIVVERFQTLNLTRTARKRTRAVAYSCRNWQPVPERSTLRSSEKMTRSRNFYVKPGIISLSTCGALVVNVGYVSSLFRCFARQWVVADTPTPIFGGSWQIRQSVVSFPFSDSPEGELR